MVSADSKDIQMRVLTKLSSLRKNVGELGTVVEEMYVHEFHASLDRLESLGIDVSEFRIPDSALFTKVLSSVWIDGVAHPSYSREKYVEQAFLLTKLDAFIGYAQYALTPIHGVEIDTLSVLERIFSNFRQVATQLRNRHNSRSTLEVRDEYDVQDLLHAVLKLFFNDIRPEEGTPSYAGSASRMDFLLKEEKVVIEVKKTSDNLGDKKIGEQLIEDVAKYQEHPDCKSLFCFVYDPEGRIGNPIGLENDLGRLSTDDFSVRVFIFPK